MRFDEFTECQTWWRDRNESRFAWRVSMSEIEASGYNLDSRNPHSSEDLAHRPPIELVDETLAAEEAVVELLHQLRSESAGAQQPATVADRSKSGWLEVELGDFLQSVTTTEPVEATTSYRIAGVYSFGRGLIDRGELLGSETSYKALGRLTSDMVVISKLGAWEGAVAVVEDAFEDFFVSSEFPRFTFHSDLTTPLFFRGLARSPSFWEAIDGVTRGSMARRKRTTPDQYLRTKLWLPPKAEQDRAVRQLELIDRLVAPRSAAEARHDALASSIFNRMFSTT
jgi:hypothetical protein